MKLNKNSRFWGEIGAILMILSIIINCFTPLFTFSLIIAGSLTIIGAICFIIDELNRIVIYLDQYTDSIIFNLQN